MNIIIFVHTCKKYEDSRAKKIEDTWGNRENVVFITDNKNSSLKNYIYTGERSQGKKVPTYHPQTIANMFYLFINSYSSYDWFMMIDDDSYLYIEKLSKYLSYHDKDDYLMIGDFLNWTMFSKEHKPDYNSWIGGGAGIVFTKKCIMTYLDIMKSEVTRSGNKTQHNHDLWLHHLYKSGGKENIKRIHCSGFHQSNEKEVLKKYPIDSNLLISIHLNGNLELLDKFHNPKVYTSKSLQNNPI